MVSADGVSVTSLALQGDKPPLPSPTTVRLLSFIRTIAESDRRPPETDKTGASETAELLAAPPTAYLVNSAPVTGALELHRGKDPVPEPELVSVNVKLCVSVAIPSETLTVTVDVPVCPATGEIDKLRFRPLPCT